MDLTHHKNNTGIQLHSWLRNVNICFVPGEGITPLVEEFVSNLLDAFRSHGSVVQNQPDNASDILLTSAPFDEVVSWRKSLLFTGRIKYHLDQNPVVFTVIHAPPRDFDQALDHFKKALNKKVLDPRDYDFPGLSPEAYMVLYEQGNRGGPMLALERLLQAQSKSIHIILLIGDEAPTKVFHFDLVGAFPESNAQEQNAFYSDIVIRMITRVSTSEITDHQISNRQVSYDLWRSLKTPHDMQNAANELGKRNFFTEMVQIDKLVRVPVVAGAVAEQYSEGCFATWDPLLGALISTVTGSARPIDKSQITENDLAIIEGVRVDGRGAIVRHVEGKRNDPPSSEAVEMMDMDNVLPRIKLVNEAGDFIVPVSRSKLHGHRGISSFSPEKVEFIELDPPYYKYPVSCATAAQAKGIRDAFSRSIALNNPNDPRQVVFTILPTHGVVIVEKWAPNTVPLQTIWEYFDSEHLVVDNEIPQGLVKYELRDGKMFLVKI